MCREAVASREGEEVPGLSKGLNASILMMLAVPMALGLGLGFLIYLNSRPRNRP